MKQNEAREIKQVGMKRKENNTTNKVNLTKI